MASHIEAPKFELLRAKWEAQQADPNNLPLPPTTPGRTPAQQRQFYTSSSETRESKVRRFSSFATFATPINPFTRRDRAAMPFPKSPSYKALVAPEKREEPPPPLKRGPGSRLPSFKSSSNAMPPPALPSAKHDNQPSERRKTGRLARSQTISNIPLLTSSAPEPVQQFAAKRLPSGLPPRKATGLRQPSQSTSNLIRSRPPTPHRSADEPMPVTPHSTNNLISLTSSSSSASVRSKLPTPALNRDTRQSGMATKMFGGMLKAPKAGGKRSHTQPNLTSAANTLSQLVTPRQTVFREEFATKTPRYMASENSKPLPSSDDLFGPVGGVEVPEVLDDEDPRRYGALGAKDWGDLPAVETPTTIKPTRTSDIAHRRHRSQLPRLHSAGSLPQNNLLTPLSPPFPRTPRHSTAHSQNLFSPGSGTNPPTILRHSHLSPCLEDSNPKTAIRFISTGHIRAWSPPPSPTPTPSSQSSSSPSLPSSPTPTSGGNRDVNAPPPSYALVNKAQPSSYWAGRFMSGFDRLRLDAFHAEGHAFRTSGRVSDTFGSFVDGTEEARARRVFAELAACCRSDEAARSLRDFQSEWARRCGSVACMPSPAVIVLNGGGGSGNEDKLGGSGNNVSTGGGEEGLRGGEGKGRKTGMGFMDRLRGIARKTSA
ncbi:hypothetical protein SLS55_001100 [Diplodia seriata]|uniref:Uncharacterized protein n=1 Tax=Diplodia seriata TaxID=420778 RepID=A0ABR3CW67_9PEZI